MRLLSSGTLIQNIMEYKCIFNKNIRNICVQIHIHICCAKLKETLCNKLK